MSETEVKSRKFLGKVPAKTTFEKAHLKAYLKGKQIFNFGFTGIGLILIPNQFKVQQELIFNK